LIFKFNPKTFSCWRVAKEKLCTFFARENFNSQFYSCGKPKFWSLLMRMMAVMVISENKEELYLSICSTQESNKHKVGDINSIRVFVLVSISFSLYVLV
jgi:hypothetical protein